MPDKKKQFVQTPHTYCIHFTEDLIYPAALMIGIRVEASLYFVASL